jgi:hypothetical protein
VAGLRWLFIFVIWAALDLSSPLLLVPVEALEESEEATHRSPLRRRDRALEIRVASARRQGIQEDAARLSRLVAAARPRRGHEADAPRKLPPADPGPDPASDDH